MMLDGHMSTLEVAKHEYAEMGTISTDTYMALTNEGFDADIVLAQLAGELEDGE
jgi:oligoribonuclease (3'-5' exoribonuclease)